MIADDINKKSIASLSKTPRNHLEQVLTVILNKLDEAENQINALKEINQKLRDEINRLKGEKGKPNIHPKQDKKDNGLPPEYWTWY